MYENLMQGICVLKNDISMQENESFATGVIFHPPPLKKNSWVIGLYTISCMEFSLMNIFGQNVHFHPRKPFVRMSMLNGPCCPYRPDR